MKQSCTYSIWALAIIALACMIPQPASAGALCAVGTGAVFSCAGPGVANVSGGGAVNVTTLGVTFLLNDGLLVSFNINETITGNLGAGPTTSAVLRISNLVAQDLGALTVSDNIYIFSDAFNPATAGTAGVGVIGFYGAAFAVLAPPVGGFYSGSSQAQMNYLTTPVGIGGPVGGPSFSLTTPSTFAIGAPLPPFAFYEWARAPIGAGTRQIVGGLNFTLTPGSEIYMPGSLIIDDNNPDVFNSEAPEPASFGFMASGLVGLAALLRRRRT